MITWMISSRTDLETYVADAFPDAVEHGLDTALVDALVLQSPVDYGRDWTEWLDDNAAGYLAELSEHAGN